jgi:hypothetical protein
MRHLARKASSRAVQFAPLDCQGQNDPHDEIDLELLGLWLGLARLRDKIRGNRDRRTARVTVKPAKPPQTKKPRRKAA